LIFLEEDYIPETLFIFVITRFWPLLCGVTKQNAGCNTNNFIMAFFRVILQQWSTAVALNNLMWKWDFFAQ
jgi:hypothetical protein